MNVVTFRDDHDAALARADALAEELRRAERERDELKARVDRLEHAPGPALAAPPSPTSAIARVRAAPLQAAELARLVGLVQDAAAQRSSERAVAMMLLSAMAPGSVVLAVLAGVGAVWISGVSAVVLASMLSISGGSSHADARAVISALSDAPEQIVAVKQHWRRGVSLVIIETKEHRLLASGAHNAEMIALLARRCPRATFDGG